MLDLLYAKNVEAVSIIVLLFTVPAFTLLFDYMLRKDELLESYGAWLERKWEAWQGKWYRKLLKIIGLCPPCMQVWLGVIYMIIFGVSIKYFLIIIPLNFLILRIFLKQLDE